jgi:predicted nucleic acid-binding protein
MSLIYWDSMLFIYHFDGHPRFGSVVSGILDRMEARGDALCTSAFGVAEVLAGPWRTGALDLVERYKKFLKSPGISLIDFGFGAASRFAEIRGRLRVSPPDAIHLACAAEAGVDLFLTHDLRLAGKFVPGIQFIADLSSPVL